MFEVLAWLALLAAAGIGGYYWFRKAKNATKDK